MKYLALYLMIVAFQFVAGCAGMAEYNSHVSERSDSIAGYAKDNGSAGGAYTHTVKYK